MAPFSVNSSSIGEDITPESNGGVKKFIVKSSHESNNLSPLIGDTVTIHYIGVLENGAQFYSTRENGRPFTFVLGRGDVIKALDISILTMKHREIALIHSLPLYAYGSIGLPPLITSTTNLIFEIELLSFEGEDITAKKNGGIRKSIITKGEDSRVPYENAHCLISYKGFCNNEIFEEKLNLKFDLGDGIESGLVPGIERAIYKMSYGEKSRLKLSHVYGYGVKGCDKLNIPANCQLIYEIHLHHFEQVKQHWEMDNCELLETATKNKEKGNSYFKTEKYILAKKKYKQCKLFAESATINLDEKMKNQKQKLFLTSYLNISLCHLKCGSFLRAFNTADLALKIDPNNVKGLYRRAMAHLNMANYEESIMDFNNLLKFEPNNKNAQISLSQSLQKFNDQKNKEKNLFSGMFNKFADMDCKKEYDLYGRKEDVFSNIGDWDNELAQGMMTLEQEMAAFGEKMPEPKYNSKNLSDFKETENPESDDDC